MDIEEIAKSKTAKDIVALATIVFAVSTLYKTIKYLKDGRK